MVGEFRSPVWARVEVKAATDTSNIPIANAARSRLCAQVQTVYTSNPLAAGLRFVLARGRRRSAPDQDRAPPMHASSLENMQRCYEHFLTGSPLLERERIRVVDIGGANVNGSYADIFSDELFDYIAADIEPGTGVDLVLDDPYRLPFEDDSVDIVCSGQALEHVEFFWRLFEEIARVTATPGFIFLVVPSAGPVHRYPVDCYRFYPDAMDALARYTNLLLVDKWLDRRGPWNDLVGVFSRREAPSTHPDGPAPPVNRFSLAQAPVPTTVTGATEPDQERVTGRVSYLETLLSIHEALEPRGYLEIGVRKGKSLALASCPAVAVDPEPELAGPLPQRHRLVRMPSDAFFRDEADSALSGLRLDLAFIDGMHRFEFALRDFMHIEERAGPDTVVVIDDIYPNHAAQAARDRRTRVWTGDVWKLHHCLEVRRPDLVLVPIDTAPTGLLVIAGLDPSSRVLWQNYNPLVHQYVSMPFDDHQDRLLTRRDAMNPEDSRLTDLLGLVRAERGRDAPIRDALARSLDARPER